MLRPRFGVGRRAVRFIPAPPAAKIYRKIPLAFALARVPQAILGPKTFYRSLGLDQGPVYREVVVRSKLLDPRRGHHAFENL